MRKRYHTYTDKLSFLSLLQKTMLCPLLRFSPKCIVLAIVCNSLFISAYAQQADDPLATLIFEAVVLNSEANPAATNNAATYSEIGAPSQALASNKAIGNIEVALTNLTDLQPASIIEYQGSINSLIEAGEQYSLALSEQYQALGILLFKAGDFEQAIEAFEDAIHIHKVNNGLFNLEQTSLVENLISTHIALGDFDSVDKNKHYLYYLQDKSLEANDPRLIAAQIGWADWNVEAYMKGYRDTYTYPVALTDSINSARNISNRVQFDVPINQEPIDNSGISSPNIPDNVSTPDSIPVTLNVPMLNSNSVMTNAAITDYNLRSVPFALSSEIVVNQRLHEAEEIYNSILEEMEKNSAPLIAQQEIHYKLANINFLLKKQLDQFSTIKDRGSIAYNRVNNEYTSDADLLSSRRYISSKNSFTKFVEEVESSAENSAEEKARAYIALGDLHLSFNRPQRAFQSYGKANAILHDAGYSADAASYFLTPAPAIAVPEYGVHNYSREFFGISAETDIPFLGYIDVHFTKDKLGSINNINILESSAQTPAQITSALTDHLRNQRFRPLMADGAGLAQENVELRYYYYY